MAQNDLMHEPPDDGAIGEAPEARDDGGPDPAPRVLCPRLVYTDVTNSFSKATAHMS
jgi:hypothetical protein